MLYLFFIGKDEVFGFVAIILANITLLLFNVFSRMLLWSLNLLY